MFIIICTISIQSLFTNTINVFKFCYVIVFIILWSWVPPLFLILHWDFIFHANWTIMEADWLSDWLNDKKTCICRVSKYLLMNIYLGRFMFGLKKDGFMIAWSFQICLWISFFNVGMEGKKRGRERGSIHPWERE